MQNRILWIDTIKAFAILFVIFIHSSTPFVTDNVQGGAWMIANIYDSMSRMAVPLFFMVSGVLFLNKKDESLIIFFKKRFLKIIIPLIVWSFVYILLKKYVAHQDINIVDNLIYALNKPVYYHLWFMYSIIGIYLMLPIVKVFNNHASINIKYYYLALWFVSVAIIPLINSIYHTELETYMPIVVGYIGYFILGDLLKDLQLTRTIYYSSILIFIISTLMTIIGTASGDTFTHMYYDNFSVTTVMQSIAMFIILKYLTVNYIINSEKLSKIVILLSTYSLGIYLIHPILLRLIKKLNFIDISLIVEIPVYAFLTYILSYMGVYFIKKILYLKHIAP